MIADVPLHLKQDIEDITAALRESTDAGPLSLGDAANAIVYRAGRPPEDVGVLARAAWFLRAQIASDLEVVERGYVSADDLAGVRALTAEAERLSQLRALNRVAVEPLRRLSRVVAAFARTVRSRSPRRVQRRPALRLAAAGATGRPRPSSRELCRRRQTLCAAYAALDRQFSALYELSYAQATADAAKAQATLDDVKVADPRRDAVALLYSLGTGYQPGIDSTLRGYPVEARTFARYLGMLAIQLGAADPVETLDKIARLGERLAGLKDGEDE